MTLQPPKTKKVSQIGSQSQRDSRMSAQEAHDALASVQAQLAAHAETCAACYRAQQAKKARTTSWALWTPCDAARAFGRTRLALEHRLRYLLNQRVKDVAAAHDPPLSAWAFRRECPEEYRHIASQFGE